MLIHPLYDGDAKIIEADCIAALDTLGEGTVQMCVTSPPYYGQRDYRTDGQIGLENTPDDYIAKLVKVFRAVRRVLADDGTLWINIGDSYTRDSRVRWDRSLHVEKNWKVDQKMRNAPNLVRDGIGYKPKDLIGIPWLLAFALRADGWYLRQDVIWHKPNVMPESVTDRCTKAHEYLFLLSKSERYYFDGEAIKEPAVCPRMRGPAEHPDKLSTNGNGGLSRRKPQPFRNRRSVWTVPTKPYKGAHFATFPPELIEPTILASSRKGDVVLDPFSGSGTTGEVALSHRRRYLGCEINPEYVKLSLDRLRGLHLTVDITALAV